MSIQVLTHAEFSLAWNSLIVCDACGSKVQIHTANKQIQSLEEYDTDRKPVIEIFWALLWKISLW